MDNDGDHLPILGNSRNDVYNVLVSKKHKDHLPNVQWLFWEVSFLITLCICNKKEMLNENSFFLFVQYIFYVLHYFTIIKYFWGTYDPITNTIMYVQIQYVPIIILQLSINNMILFKYFFPSNYIINKYFVV